MVLGALWGILFVVITGGNFFLQIIFFLFLFGIGYISCGEIYLKTENPDPPEVIIDEALGIMVTLIGEKIKIYYATVGFFLFLLFDFLKPFPIRRLEKLPPRWGILLDDVVAGIYAHIVLKIWKKITL